MSDKLENLSSTLKMVKMPDGRIVNIKIENNEDNEKEIIGVQISNELNTPFK